MDMDVNGIVTTIIGLLGSYIGFRGVQAENRVKALEDKNHQQDVELATLKESHTNLKGEVEKGFAEIKEDVKEVAGDVKKLLTAILDRRGL